MKAIQFDRWASRQSWFGRCLRWPLDRLPKEMALPILSGPLRTRRWVVGAGIHRCWLGTYERAKQRELGRYLQRDMVVYDVGANAGFYTLLMARAVGLNGNVYAFEPSAHNLRYLRLHLRLNRIENVFVTEAAVADFVGEHAFSGARGSYQACLDPNGATKVPVVSLDHLMDTGRLLPGDLLKIDVEGAEYRVLRGAERLLRRYRPTVFLATHGPDVHRECCRFLRSIGFQLYPLDRGARLEESDELVAVNR